MPTAQPEAAAPQLEAHLGHSLPLGAHLVVRVRQRVVAHVLAGADGDVAWN